MIDLRSDTVTIPSAGMRKAMYEAEVGDDVFGEDPTVNHLQETVAELLGKEAALFVPSGVMGNQLGIKVHTHPGDAVVLDHTSHIFVYESGGPSLLSGVHLLPLEGSQGVLTGPQVREATRPGFYWQAEARLICLENTLNKAGGRVYPHEQTLAVAAVAQERGLRLHLDGARLWNATAATGIPEKTYAAPFDTVIVSLSKGLGAPVGSLLVGSREHIEAARRFRKVFGGGMRQVGVLAAAGLYGLQHHRPLLAHDHALARRLAEGLAPLTAFHLDLPSVETNIVVFDVVAGDAGSVLATLREEGILMVPFGPKTIRATTHRDVSASDIDTVLQTLTRRFSQGLPA